MSLDAQKRRAAIEAADLVEPDMLVGLGTGSTATHFIARLIERARDGLKIACIPTSERSAAQAREGGLRLIDFSTAQTLDLTVDGADEICLPRLDLIKGLGGALLREKIVAANSTRVIIIADDTKLVPTLGARTPVPVEVTPFGWHATRRALETLGATCQLREINGASYVTDGGNYILDAKFPGIADPTNLAAALKSITGVVETGIFAGLARAAIVASTDGIRRYNT